MFSILNKSLAETGFYINLDDSVERKDFIDKQIYTFQIQGLNRFSALTDDLRQYSCTKSHRAIFEYALNKGYDTIFVAEDDFQIYNISNYYNNFSISLNNFLTRHHNFILNDDYDILMFGCNPKKNIIPINNGFGINQASTGAWSYIIKRKAMEYILDKYNYYRDYQAIDDILPSLNGLGFKTIVTIPMLIGHRNGIESTLQPNIGITNYSTWIEGNWHKHLYAKLNDYASMSSDIIETQLESRFQISKKLTVVIAGHCVNNWLFYLRYLLHSMPNILYECRFIISYDSCNNDDSYNIYRFFRDIRSDIHPYISFVNHGLISSLDNILKKIQTEYFLFLEHDWVFLNKENINFHKLLNVFDKYKFVNAVWFNKDDNQLRGFEICDNHNFETTPYRIEDRIKEIPLITTCRWSNNPAIFRTSKMKEWFNILKTKNAYINSIHQAASNVEETLIPIYREQILQNGWDNVKDNWGTFLYGNIGDGPYVGHTDASQRYQGHSKSQPEINGEEYIKNNPLSNLDF